MTTAAPDLLSTFVHLRADGSASSVPWTPDIWRTLVLADGDRVVGARRGEMPADFHPDMWEMHRTATSCSVCSAERSTRSSMSRAASA